MLPNRQNPDKVISHEVEVLELGDKEYLYGFSAVRPLRVRIDGTEFSGTLYLIFSGGVGHYRVLINNKQVSKHPDWSAIRQQILEKCALLRVGISSSIAKIGEYARR